MLARLRSKDGFTLIGVLVFCLILIPVCATLAQSSRSLARGVRGGVDAFKRELLAAGLADAVAAKVGSNRTLFDRLNERPLVARLRNTRLPYPFATTMARSTLTMPRRNC